MTLPLFNPKWCIGGRWDGSLKIKKDSLNQLGKTTCSVGLPKFGWVDSARLGDIDFEGMKEEAAKEANETYDKLEKILKGRPLPSWIQVREKHKDNIDAARAEYQDMEVVQDLNAAHFFILGDFVETFGPNRDAYVERCKNSAGVTRAIVKNGKWYERGEMGWFGMSRGDMSEDDWNKQFWEILSDVHSETKVTVIDCHI